MGHDDEDDANKHEKFKSLEEIFGDCAVVVISRNMLEGKLPIYPAVGTMCANDVLKVNFGQDPFVFDVKNWVNYYMAKRNQQQQDTTATTDNEDENSKPTLYDF